MKGTVFCDVMLCIVLYCHGGVGLTVTPIIQTNARFTVHLQSCQGPSNCPECNATGRTIQTGALLMYISYNHAETRFLFCDPVLGINKIHGREIIPPVHVSCA